MPTRLLANYSGRSWAMLTVLDDVYYDAYLQCHSPSGNATVYVSPDDESLWSMVEAMRAKRDSVPAYALSDALRERSADIADTIMADLLAETVPVG